MTSIATGSPSGAAATNRVSPQTCSAASARSETVTPSPDSARPTCSSDGVAAGVPTTRWNAAATPHAERDARERRRRACRRAPTSAPSAPSVSSATTSRRAGRSRYGAATNNIVVATASTMTGYSGLAPCDRETGGAPRRAGVDPRPQPDARGPAECARDDQQQQQPEPAGEQEREREHHDRADRTDVVEHLGARTDPRRQIRQDVEDRFLEPADVVGAERGDDDDERRDPESHEVARPAPVRALRHDAEHGRHPASGRDRR